MQDPRSAPQLINRSIRADFRYTLSTRDPESKQNYHSYYLFLKGDQEIINPPPPARELLQLTAIITTISPVSLAILPSLRVIRPSPVFE